MDQANTRLANEFVYGPGLLMDYVGPMPTPEEAARAVSGCLQSSRATTRHSQSVLQKGY